MSAAYELLIDPEKKAKWDQFGSAALGRQPEEGDAATDAAAAAAAATGTAASAASVGQMIKPCKRYSVDFCDPRNWDLIPRWPNDGLEISAQEFASGNKTHYNISDASATQKRLTDLLGGWPTPRRLEEDGGQFLMSLPFTVQRTAANRTDNHEAALDYLAAIVDKTRTVVADKPTSRQKKEAKLLIKIANLRSALSKGRKRFPSLEAIMLVLAKAGLDSDKNLDRLFGSVTHVRGLALQCGSSVTAPATSPSALHVLKVIGDNGDIVTNKLKRAQPKCEWCLTPESESHKLLRCERCHNKGGGSAKYCNEKCRDLDWPIHKLSCYRKRGKTVKPHHEAEARAAEA